MSLVACRHEPDGEVGGWKIVFQSNRDGEWATHAVDPDGTGRIRIAPSDGPAGGPAITSPDGRQAVVPGVNELRLVRAGEEGSKRLASGLPSTAAWSPNGKRIAFVGLSPGLSVIDSDGSNGRRLTRNRGDGNPAWSPDGESIAYTRNGVGVMVIDRDGRRRRVVAPEDASVVRWSPDGRSILFITGVYNAVLFTVSASTGRTLHHARVAADEPVAWSPDGRWIAYRLWPHLFVMRTDGTRRARVATRGSQPAWSPDGQSLAYTEYIDGGSSQIFTIRRDGSGRRRLTSPYPNGGDAMQPAWVRGPFEESPSPYRLRPKSRRDGAMLELPYPVVSLGAEGSLAVLVSPPRFWGTLWVASPPLVLWDPARGRVSRVARMGCNVTESVAVLGEHVAFDCGSGHAASFGRTILVFRAAHPRPARVASGWIGEGNNRSSLPGRIAGGGDLVVFSRTPVRGWRPTGAPRELRRLHRGETGLLVSGPDAGEPAAVGAGRVAVERADGVVTLLTADGRVLGRLAVGRAARPKVDEVRRPTVGLTREHLVVLRSGRLYVFDARSLRRLRSQRVPSRATLAGAARGFTAFVVAGDVHVVRLADGRATVLRTGGRGVDARLTSAGLFYVVHERSVAGYQSQPFTANPATVVFVRRVALVRRFRTSR